MRFIAYVLYGLSLGIVFFGVTNSYRITVYERRKEIGHAQGPRHDEGFHRETVFYWKAWVLPWFLRRSAPDGLSLLVAVERIDFSFVSGFDLFLRGGSLQFSRRAFRISSYLGAFPRRGPVRSFQANLAAASVPHVEAMRENR